MAAAIASIELDDSVFDVASYALPIPTLDGHKAVQLEVRLSGSGPLDRTSTDDLALLEPARLGNQVRLIVVAESLGKSFSPESQT
jgi:hypothetical protein